MKRCMEIEMGDVLCLYLVMEFYHRTELKEN